MPGKTLEPISSWYRGKGLQRCRYTCSQVTSVVDATPFMQRFQGAREGAEAIGAEGVPPSPLRRICPLDSARVCFCRLRGLRTLAQKSRNLQAFVFRHRHVSPLPEALARACSTDCRGGTIAHRLWVGLRLREFCFLRG